MAKRSAGILLWRRGSDGVEVLLAHPGGPLFERKDDGSWSIPKGEYDADEHPLVAARREFTEEMGTPPPDAEPLHLGDSRQSNGKVNTIWAIEGTLDASQVRSNGFTMQWPPRSGRLQEFPEVDRAEWFSLATRARTKIFASQAVFLDRLADALARNGV